MGGRKAEKSVDFLKIRDAEERNVTESRFLEISLCASTREFESLSLRQSKKHPQLRVLLCISEYEVAIWNPKEDAVGAT